MGQHLFMDKQKWGMKKTDKKIGKKVKRDMKDDKMTRKILLLGAGESGKSTVFKQMKLTYLETTTRSPTEISSQKKECVHHLVQGAQGLIPYLRREDPSNELIDFLDSTQTKGSIEAIMNFSTIDADVLDVDFAEALVYLWDNSYVRSHWEKVWPSASLAETWSKFANDFLASWKKEANTKKEKEKRWGRKTWVPSGADQVLARKRTTGISQHTFTNLSSRGLKLRLIDVGGQRNERKKWLGLLSDVNAVLYVAAISEYNQVLFEAEDVNRLQESLHLFESILQDETFQTKSNKGTGEETDFILFLNKTDLFETKLCDRRIPLNISGLFEDAPTGKEQFDLKANKEWLEKKFTDIHSEHRPNGVFSVHFTTATSHENLKHVLDFVKNSVLEKLLEDFIS